MLTYTTAVNTSTTAIYNIASEEVLYLGAVAVQ